MALKLINGDTFDTRRRPRFTPEMNGSAAIENSF